MAFFYTFKFVYHFPCSLCSQICPALPVSTCINPVFPFSTFIFFSKIHFILKHHYLNDLFLVFLFLLIINVKQIKIQDCNQHMRKNIQCLLFCICYLTQYNCFHFHHLPPYFINSIHPLFTEYSRDYIILSHFNFNNNICTKYLIINLLQIIQCLMKHFCQFLHK